MIAPATQLARFQRAVDLLGGTRSAARVLDISERHMTRLLTGKSELHTGMLADMAKALINHAEACRQLERQLSPAFAANLVEGQPVRPKPRGIWSDKGEA